MDTKERNQIIAETVSLHLESEFTKHAIDQLQNKLKENQLARFVHWLQFLNEQWYKANSVFYTSSITALISLFQYKCVLLNQTEHEFEMSKVFLKHVFQLNKNLMFDQFQACRKLYLLAFMFARYHGMLQHSLLNQFRRMEGSFTIDDFVRVMQKGFVKYESPAYFFKNIDYMDEDEIHLLMQVQQGKNFRNHKLLPVKLSGREFSDLYCMEWEGNFFQDRIMQRGVIITKMRKISKQDNLINAFLVSSYTFLHNPEIYLNDIEYWLKGFELTEDVNRMDRNGNVTHTVDFLEFKKYHSNEPFSLKGRTPASLRRLAREWMESIFEMDFTESRKLSWDPINKRSIELQNYGNRYQFIELHTGESIYQEGKALKHCVATYIPNCSKGRCTIWSMQIWDEPEKRFESLITLEVTNDQLVQARGYKDRLPHEKEIKLINQWAEMAQFEIKLTKNF